MSNVLIIGFTTEGNTDVRFLEHIIRRTFEDIAFECESLIEIHSVQHIPIKKNSFAIDCFNAAQKAYNAGFSTYCIHSDADNESDKPTLSNRIEKAFQMILNELSSEICKNLVPIVPIQMTEAWMLADIELLKEEIGTDKNTVELGLHRSPESIADPKYIITEAIRIAFSSETKRKRSKIDISELYSPIGQKLCLNKLSYLTSYKKFREEVRKSFVRLNFLQPKVSQ
ncbi:DUF4276 family protein [Chitinophaga sp.]|uniref:DUF4276 family protein n=1 Tax=Chitinophaga sp. TaxID=1869181 RepID=UPI0031D91E56